MRSDLPIPVSEILKEELQVREMTQKDLADKMKMSPNTVSEIIRGKRDITVYSAIRLEAALGISAVFWLNFQSDYKFVLSNLNMVLAIDRVLNPNRS